MRALILALVTILLAGTVAGERAASGPLPRGYNGLAATPPMGWNNYNAYGLEVTEQLIRETADKMVSSGMRDAGYVYVTIDDGWMAGTRDASGNLRADPERFPSGIAALAAYVHARGLKLGIYEDAGVKTCGGLPGSLGHETADAETFAAWGVDYLKYDNCYAAESCGQYTCSSSNETERYAAMRDALLASGRPIVFSVCSWGTDAVWRWGAGYGNLWRTTADIQPTYESMVLLFKETVGLGGFAGPGGWNDPDMLEIGNGMSAVEDRTEMTLWAAMAAPLIAGTDLVHADAATLALLTNRAVIAIDQDPLGAPARVVSSDQGHYVLERPLADGDTAVVLFNETDTAAVMAADLSGSATDLWSGESTPGTIRTEVPAHGAMLYRVGQS
ncbi:glycoside hydrolase family 27 protein [Actinoplanes sp. CA-142083]|uniref:glycoside hydrolase family 27 protein n=1 Tax=Actinoplanes sp. CA-142083 TaxID=3239903 RepID=UPI003D8F6264